jgi:hypothetical protein
MKHVIYLCTFVIWLFSAACIAQEEDNSPFDQSETEYGSINEDHDNQVVKMPKDIQKKCESLAEKQGMSRDEQEEFYYNCVDDPEFFLDDIED